MPLPSSDRQFAPGRIARLVGRALLRRCPHCGGDGLFSSWLKIRESCPRCGLRLERGEDGYIVGAYMFNLVGSELIFAALFLGTVVASWPTPPWDLLQYAGGVFMIAAPFLFYPFAKTLFLAFDLIFRPARADELSR